MSQFTEVEVDALRRVHRALEAGGGLFVIAGGWAARLLRAHRLASLVPFEPILTNDLDVAAPHKPPRKGNDVGIALAEQGFVADYRTDDRPPVTRYEFKDLELEFIAARFPSRHPTETVEVLGVSAQRAQDVELLLLEPVLIPFPELDVGAVLSVANPASFLLQRLLTIPARRSREKKGKDALYLHDTLLLFSKAGQVNPEICAQAARIEATMTKDQGARAADFRVELEDPDHPVIREAARQAAATGRPGPNTPEAIALVIRLGLAQLSPK